MSTHVALFFAVPVFVLAMAPAASAQAPRRAPVVTTWRPAPTQAAPVRFAVPTQTVYRGAPATVRVARTPTYYYPTQYTTSARPAAPGYANTYSYTYPTRAASYPVVYNPPGSGRR